MFFFSRLSIALVSLVLAAAASAAQSSAAAASAAQSSAAAASAEQTYTVRLFWRQVPEAIELAPPEPFAPSRAPLLQLSDGRQLMLRRPIRIAADNQSLRLGQYPFTLVSALKSRGLLRLRIPGGTWATFSGALRLWTADSELHVEIEMPREAYVAAVLAGEAGAIRQPEALKAIAVAIRSYAFAVGTRHSPEGFAFCDTTHCQDLRLASRHPLLNEAVAETAHELLWKQGVPVPAWHHADSGGHTEDARVAWGKDAPAWMRGLPDPFSLRPQPGQWTCRIPKQDIARALAAEGFPVSPSGVYRILARHPSGRAAQADISGRQIPAAVLRFAIGRHLGWNLVRSDLYQLRDDADAVLFQGRGAGHGVGLSQRGAAAMAKAGKSYRDILAFYFPGTQVGIGAQGIRWTQRGQGLLRIWFAGPVDEGFPALADRELHRMEAATGFELRQSVQIRVYPTLDTYRNHAGNPGWMAAGARSAGREHFTIALQPLHALRESASLEPLLRHELAHVLVLQEAAGELPRWLHEGLARWLARSPFSADEPHSTPGNSVPFPTFKALDEAFLSQDAARRRLASVTAERWLVLAVRNYGMDAVLDWVRHGPPHQDDALLRKLQQFGQR